MNRQLKTELFKSVIIYDPQFMGHKPLVSVFQLFGSRKML